MLCLSISMSKICLHASIVHQWGEPSAKRATERANGASRAAEAADEAEASVFFAARMPRSLRLKDLIARTRGGKKKKAEKNL